MQANLKPFDQVKLYISHSRSSSDRFLVFDLANYLEKGLSKAVSKKIKNSSSKTAATIVLLKVVSKAYTALIETLKRIGVTRRVLKWLGFYMDRQEVTLDAFLDSGEGAVEVICDRKLNADSDTSWYESDRSAIKTANLFLLMVSPDYLESDHCRSLMDEVRSRERAGLATVIPIMLRPVEWQPPNGWICLPKNGQAVTDWRDSQAAFDDIRKEIVRTIPARVRRVWVEKDTLGKEYEYETGDLMKLDNQILLGLAIPESVSRGSKFVVRFAAYTPVFHELVGRNLKMDARVLHHMPYRNRCQWEPGTAVSVGLHSRQCRVVEPQKTFVWNGEWEILRFEVEVPRDAAKGTAVLKFDVYIEGFVVASHRAEITIAARGRSSAQSRHLNLQVPRSAFASYSSWDEEQVMNRIRSLQIVADINVFLNCLSMRPGEQRKAALQDEISRREIFWLFWSRAAMASEFVEWEWQTAYMVKDKSRIQPHPLEPTDVAPPPKQLEDLQFDNAFEAYLHSRSRVRR